MWNSPPKARSGLKHSNDATITKIISLLSLTINIAIIDKTKIEI